MAIRILSDDPAGLLNAIKIGIEQGHVKTWTCDADGDFTHSIPQWNGQAWLRPTPKDTYLLLNILNRTGADLSTELYAIFHGRFIEMVLAHFDDRFSKAESTAMPTNGDHVAG
jgi:hypothetical protein